MIVTSALLAILAAAGVSAQRGGGRWNSPAPAPTTQAPAPPQPTTPPPPLGSTQSMWGQCGGVDWEYATACPQGSLCYNDGENEWYSQCIPEADIPDNKDSPPLADNPSVETRIMTTIFDVPGPTPTVVTTYITIYTEAPQPSPQPPPPPPAGVTITAVPDSPIPRYRRGM